MVPMAWERRLCGHVIGFLLIAQWMSKFNRLVRSSFMATKLFQQFSSSYFLWDLKSL